MNIEWGIILAGGQSKRLGLDKAALDFDGIPLLEKVYVQLREVFKHILIIGEKRQIGSVPLNLYTGDRVNNIGPLGGLHTALAETKKTIFLCSCDMPFITVDHIRLLVNQHDQTYAATVPRTKQGIEPLFAVYQAGLLERIEKNIEKKVYALFRLFENERVQFVDFNDLIKYNDTFFNINTLRDYKKALYIERSVRDSRYKA